MPFTFSHPAAVLPLRRWCPQPLNFPALVAGSLAPDIGYYLHLWNLGAFAHTLVGSIIADIPLSIALAVLFYLIRKPAALMLPTPHSEFWLRAGNPVEWTPRAIVSMAFSALIGAWTHIIWDGFTHSYGWFVTRASVLSISVFSIDGHVFPVYKLLQYASSLAGLLLIAFVYVRMIRTLPDQEIAELRRESLMTPAAQSISNADRLLVLIALSIFATVVSFLIPVGWASPPSGPETTFQRIVFVHVVNWFSCFCSFFIVTALCMSRLRRK